MNIVDLTQNYVDSLLGRNDMVGYENAYPELFEHYFSYWGDKETFKGALSETEVYERKALVVEELSFIEKRTNDFGLETSEISLVLFVGQGYTNGHSFRHNERYVVFLALEGYETKRQVISHGAHEIIHAIHYTKNPDFYFENKTDKELFSRLLITEGLATLLTREIMGIGEKEALWADYISDRKLSSWMSECEKELSALYKFSIKNFQNSENNLAFYTADENDIYKYRAGYYVGLKVLEEVMRRENLSAVDLLTTSRPQLEISVLNTMKDLVK